MYDTNHTTNVTVAPTTEQEPQGTGIKEDGKMFIGGLNWETTDQSLKDYFSQFGEVQECTVMRDSATGRSRGFGFLTFKDPKTVNTVMVKEHYLDGKIIDPKRAIPRDEQEKTSKIFVGGVSQEATEQEFKEFFTQFGRVIDATLMIDKDTGRPRGFGFVTFDSEAAVEAALSRPLAICGKPIEVKKAQPRGNLRDEEDRRNRRGRDFRDGGHGGVDGSQQQQGMQGQAGMPAGLTPQMMAQYWQRMQQYFALMQQQMAVAAAQGQGMGAMGMGAMNPAMMQQMQQMQKMQQMQMANNQQQQPQQQGSLSPPSQSPTPQMQNMMNPAMMQQMQNQVQGNNMGAMQGQMGNNAGNMNMGANYPGARGGPGYNAQEQLAFEQQKYEQQQQQRRVMESRAFSPYQQGGPTSWEGMYDEVPQPNIPTGPQGMNRAGSIGRGTTPQPTPSAAPANAPTGPKNAGKPGANYRGGGRGGHRGFHPYSRG
jgi:RNA-binding protein Musashi